MRLPIIRETAGVVYCPYCNHNYELIMPLCQPFTKVIAEVNIVKNSISILCQPQSLLVYI